MRDSAVFDIYHQYHLFYANSRYDLYHYESSSERWMTLLHTICTEFSGISFAVSSTRANLGMALHRQNTQSRVNALFK